MNMMEPSMPKPNPLSAAVRRVLATVATAGACVAAAPSEAAVVVTYTSFANTCSVSLNCVGDTIENGNELDLTQPAAGQAGAAYSLSPITLGTSASFSTTFRFRFLPDPAAAEPFGLDPADGITFILAVNPSGLGQGGGSLGYAGTDLSKSVAIEFDTFNNDFNGPGPDGESSNHVSIDYGGNLTGDALQRVYGEQNCTTGNNLRDGCMSNGHVWEVKIGYDGAALSVSIEDVDSGLGPQTIISNYAIDIAAILEQETAYVGFTAATGSGWERHSILSWAFADDSGSAGPPTSDVPEPATAGLIGIALVGLGLAKRSRRSRRGRRSAD